MPELIITLMIRPPVSFSLFSSNPIIELHAATPRNPLVKAINQSLIKITAIELVKLLGASAIQNVVNTKINLRMLPKMRNLGEYESLMRPNVLPGKSPKAQTTFITKMLHEGLFANISGTF